MTPDLRQFAHNMVEARIRVWLPDIETRGLDELRAVLERLANVGQIPKVDREEFAQYVTDMPLPLSYFEVASRVVQFLTDFKHRRR